jgi:SAM-dependent methyltransferase
MNTRSKTDDQVDWTHFHSLDQSWRTRLLGDLSAQYAIPRYVELFMDTFGADQGCRFLELGAGNGEVPLEIRDLAPACVDRYWVTELFHEGTRWLDEQGLLALSADAQHIPFSNSSCDAVISFDVLHHVSDPYLMAREMVRVSRGKLLLVESNGLSLGRKLMELTPGHRAAGERSYTPWQYRAFFAATCRLTRFEIHPFLFPFPGGVPPALLRALIAFNQTIEKVPFFRWQCSNVSIQIEFEK